MMGALWYVLHASVPLRPGRMLATYALIVAGVLAVLVATLVGGFGAGWTFLPPLPFYPAGPVVGLVGEPVLRRQRCSSAPASASTASTCSSRRRAPTAGSRARSAGTSCAAASRGAAAAGDRRDRRRDRRPDLLRGRSDDPASACSAAPTTTRVGFDALVAKNLVYFFGHTIANLTIYLAAAAIYVLVPRYAGRPYETTKVFVAGWMGSLVFIATAYSHHLYMDFVQPGWADDHLRRSPPTAR